MKSAGSKLYTAADLAGVLVFAVEGAAKAAANNLDLLGILALAFLTGVGGGIVRDLLIGASPPASIQDWRYSAIAFLGGFGVFFFNHFVSQVPGPVMVALDAAGLALFAVAGTEKALAYGIHPLLSILMGSLTAVGGGTLRDVFLAQVPLVFRAEIYGSAAALGAAVLVAAKKLRWSDTLATVFGGLVCFVLRVVSVWQHWNLPR